jgi:vancomycin permeability regulator SanA
MEFKTGNIISVFLFGLLIFFAIISLLRSTNFGGVASFVLITFSGVSLFSLIYSDLQIQKEVKIVAIAVNLLSTVFILSSVIMISISGRGELKFIRTLLIFLLICALGIFSVFLNVLNFDDDSILYSANDRSADSGVILGAAVWGGNRPSPVLKERIVKGFEIYRRKIVPKLVITGGGSPNELTEGEVSKNELIKFGVEPANLILENSSNSTIEQIHFVRDNLYNKNSWDKIILISDNFHLLRSKEISSFNNINADCIASDKELSAGGTASFCMKESLALIVFWMSGV